MGISVNQELNLTLTESAECIYYRPPVTANNIVTNNLIDLVRTGISRSCRIAPGRHVRITLASDPDPKFSEFDRAVLACLNAVWQDSSNPGNTFTLTYLCRQLGYTTKGGVAATSREEVATALMRLEETLLQIRPEKDFDPHRTAFIADNDLSVSPSASWNNITGVDWNRPNPLIEISRSVSGRTRAGKKFAEVTLTLTKEPLLHLYSRITGQFVTLDSRYMHPVGLDDNGDLTDSALPMTSKRIGMKFYAARQIERVRYTTEHPPRGKKKGKPVSAGTLRLSTIFDRVGLSRKEASKNKGRYIDFLTDLFSCWEAQGLIPAWSMRKGMFRSCDALIVDFSSVCASAPDQPAAAAPESAPEMALDTSSASKIAATIEGLDTIMEAMGTVIEALHVMIEALAESSKSVKTRVQSHFQTILSELRKFRMYCKYLIEHPPAVPDGAGGAEISR